MTRLILIAYFVAETSTARTNGKTIESSTTKTATEEAVTKDQIENDPSKRKHSPFSSEEGAALEMFGAMYRYLSARLLFPADFESLLLEANMYEQENSGVSQIADWSNVCKEIKDAVYNTGWDSSRDETKDNDGNRWPFLDQVDSWLSFGDGDLAWESLSRSPREDAVHVPDELLNLGAYQRGQLIEEYELALQRNMERNIESRQKGESNIWRVVHKVRRALLYRVLLVVPRYKYIIRFGETSSDLEDETLKNMTDDEKQKERRRKDLLLESLYNDAYADVLCYDESKKSFEVKTELSKKIERHKSVDSSFLLILCLLVVDEYRRIVLLPEEFIDDVEDMAILPAPDMQLNLTEMNRGGLRAHFFWDIFFFARSFRGGLQNTEGREATSNGALVGGLKDHSKEHFSFRLNNLFLQFDRMLPIFSLIFFQMKDPEVSQKRNLKGSLAYALREGVDKICSFDGGVQFPHMRLLGESDKKRFLPASTLYKEDESEYGFLPFVANVGGAFQSGWVLSESADEWGRINGRLINDRLLLLRKILGMARVSEWALWFVALGGFGTDDGDNRLKLTPSEVFESAWRRLWRVVYGERVPEGLLSSESGEGFYKRLKQLVSLHEDEELYKAGVINATDVNNGTVRTWAYDFTPSIMQLSLMVQSLQFYGHRVRKRDVYAADDDPDIDATPMDFLAGLAADSFRSQLEISFGKEFNDQDMEMESKDQEYSLCLQELWQVHNRAVGAKEVRVWKLDDTGFEPEKERKVMLLTFMKGEGSQELWDLYTERAVLPSDLCSGSKNNSLTEQGRMEECISGGLFHPYVGLSVYDHSTLVLPAERIGFSRRRLEPFLIRVAQLALGRHDISSQSFEEKPFYVDFGVGGGALDGPTRYFSSIERWKGVSFDAGFSLNSVDYYSRAVGPENVLELLKEYRVPTNVTLFATQIDSHDWWNVFTMLKDGSYRPLIIQMQSGNGFFYGTKGENNTTARIPMEVSLVPRLETMWPKRMVGSRKSKDDAVNIKEQATKKAIQWERRTEQARVRQASVKGLQLLGNRFGYSLVYVSWLAVVLVDREQVERNWGQPFDKVFLDADNARKLCLRAMRSALGLETFWPQSEDFCEQEELEGSGFSEAERAYYYLSDKEVQEVLS